MPRPRKSTPDYRYHISGQAVVTFSVKGDQKNFYLGAHGSPESRARYHKLLAEYAETGDIPSQSTHQAESVISVADVVAEAREWIKLKFANNSGHRSRFNNVANILNDEFGSTPANEFGPRKLNELREIFVQGNCRTYANSQVRSVVRIFKHAVSRELVDPIVLIKLDSLEPLKLGQTAARERLPVQPVDIDHVRKTAERLSPTLKAMIRIQVSTGMRPSELVAMKPKHIDQSGEHWIYRPEKHKTQHHGKKKAVPIIGDAREALQPFLTRAEDEYCFSPAESVSWYRQQRHANRTTPLSCGCKPGDKHTAEPKLPPGRCYDKDSYRKAITRAAKAAKVPHWFPYQLRHLTATAVRDALGVEAAQALLGHSRANMTERYAQLAEAKAVEAAAAAPKLKI